jgi:polyisoprenoid-binding protein YceI
MKRNKKIQAAEEPIMYETVNDLPEADRIELKVSRRLSFYRRKTIIYMQLKRTLALIAAALLLSSLAYAADTYRIDPAHTSVGFSVRHLGLNDVRGQFKDFAGTIVLDEGKVTDASGTIQVKSVDTGVQKRDDHLRTPDFFDAAGHPTITFKTKRVETTGGQIVMIADFTMRGVTKELRLPTTLAGPVKDPWGNQRIGLQAKAKLNRKDYGIKYHQVLETGILAVGDEVEININAEAVKESETK